MIDPEKLKQGIQILIVDDHPVVRQGIKGMLETDERFHVTGEADSANSAMQLIRESPPDLAIFDITLNKSDGLELIKDVRAMEYEFPILVMSMHEERLYAERVLKAGANGYIMKREISDGLIEAVERLCAGRIYVSASMQEFFLEQAAGLQQDRSGIAKLSDRELEVFRLLGAGETTREIAEQLSLSVKTIETYRSHIKEKLSLGNASELVSAAARWLEQGGG